MPRNLRLRLVHNLYEVTNADFLIAHKVQESQASCISELLEEPLHIEGLLLGCHDQIHIWSDECVESDYICFDACIEKPMTDQLIDSVRSKYGAVADGKLSNDHAGVKAVAEAFGYREQELTSIPADAKMGLSCGDPTALSSIRPGEVVVDLGSGGGLDVFLASPLVGPEGNSPVYI